MFRQIARLGHRLVCLENLASHRCIRLGSQTPRYFGSIINANWPAAIQKTAISIGTDVAGSHLMSSRFSVITKNQSTSLSQQPLRCFHAAGSKVKYLDFRHRLKTNHLRLHLLIIRRQKMKKHKLRKFRKKFKSLLAKQRLKREIAKEKAFRVELLSIIRRAETFDPREYVLKKLAEMNSRKKELSREEKLEQLKDLIRENRYQVDYIKPKHKRAEWVDVKV